MENGKESETVSSLLLADLLLVINIQKTGQGWVVGHLFSLFFFFPLAVPKQRFPPPVPAFGRRKKRPRPEPASVGGVDKKTFLDTWLDYSGFDWLSSFEELEFYNVYGTAVSASVSFHSTMKERNDCREE